MAESLTDRRAALAALGLAEHATAREITQAYHRLAKLSHPDATGSSDADAGLRFSTLAQAYRTLTGAEEEQSTEPATPSAASQPVENARRITVRVRSGGTTLPRRPPIVAGPVTITPLPLVTEALTAHDGDVTT